MVKKHTVWFPGAIYYVTCFGAWDESIFYEESDFLAYLSLVESVRYRYPFYLHSYCLIAKRIYLLLETTHIPMNDIITTLNDEYARYFQDKHTFVLPQASSTLIDSADKFLKASKFIHLAPLQEQIPLQNYRWSSYQAYISYTPNDHVVTSRILTFFKDPKMDQYSRFVEGEKIEVN
ncbi:hypothetical protein H1D32_22180 [Anaerobacillus sp. CMMVII]|uniref:hypothetical protein n=1 Tax=Anaerobacillus sp. CMMVII TaxID=2755588 RepID=UPI0021B82695|nr:hypothetical protein [Anaerobacillus sp. CMMVII]MCT8140165.1 hypothetical protein [Anaerobacillus sp. CMMVII]